MFKTVLVAAIVVLGVSAKSLEIGNARCSLCDLDTVAQSAFEFADQNKDGTIDVQEAGLILEFIIEKGLFSLETLGLDGLDLDLDTVGPLAFEYADQNKDGQHIQKLMDLRCLN